VGLFLSLFSIKPLNALLLGENYARSLGLNYKEQGLSSFFTTVFWQEYNCFCGPIAFRPCGSSYCKIGFSDQ
jgi:iron complex transport system permease protein